MLRHWQRQHADAIVSEVSPVDGIGTWRACAWRRHRIAQRGPWQPFVRLLDAQVAADEIACETFHHECSHLCGHWHPVGDGAENLP